MKFQYHSLVFFWKQKPLKNIFEESEIDKKGELHKLKIGPENLFLLSRSSCADKEL